MNKNEKEINIARLIYDAYPHSDLLTIEPDKDCCDLRTLLEKVTSENIGDSLFRFIVVEIVEGGESTLKGAIRVMERAAEDVKAVLQALKEAGIEQEIVHDPGAELLEACKVLTSYTMDLLYRLDDQVNLGDIEEIQQAKDAIDKYNRFVASKS